MNTAITFPPSRPALKLARASGAPSVAASTPVAEEKWAVSLAEERRRLHEDKEELRARECNLREYEARLRALQEEIQGAAALPVPAAETRSPGTAFLLPSCKMPFEGGAALQAAWDKLHRAREILEAEQTHQRDERIMMHEQEAELRRRTEAVTERERRVAEREKILAEVAVSDPGAQPIAAEQTMSAVARLTVAPFAMARSVFGGKKAAK